MVKNKRELLAMAAEWTNHAKNDMRNQLISFMESVGTDQRRLADVLGLSNGEIDQILNGNGEVTLSTFAKLLIATDNVLEIKPLTALNRGGSRGNGGATPKRDSRGRFVPKNGGMPMPPMGGQMPPMGGGYPSPEEMRKMRGNGGMPMPPMGGQMPPRFGGMPGMGQHMNGGMPMPPMGGQIPPMNCEEVDLDELSRKELINLIRQQGFDGEIDVRNASRGELIDFLEMKQQAELPNVAHRENMEVDGEPMAENTAVENADGGVQNNTDEHLVEMLMSELDNNPRLREVVSRYMNR